VSTLVTDFFVLSLNYRKEGARKLLLEKLLIVEWIRGTQI
jgi:hypothetical protein